MSTRIITITDIDGKDTEPKIWIMEAGHLELHAILEGALNCHKECAACGVYRDITYMKKDNNEYICTKECGEEEFT